MSSASFTVIVNGGSSSFFTAFRGLRQEDPLSPILFIITMEALSRLLEQAKELNLLRNINIGGRSSQTELHHIFFVDDNLIFCQPETSMLLHLRSVILYFQAVSGLKINLHKSELVRIGDGSDWKSFAQVLGCTAAQLLIKYLGLPLGAKYKDGSTWEPIIKLFENRLAGRKMKFLSKGGRLTLIKTLFPPSLSTICYYSPSLTRLQRDWRPSNADFFGGKIRKARNTIWLSGRTLNVQRDTGDLV